MFLILDGVFFCAATGGFGDYIQAVAIPPHNTGLVAKTQHPRCHDGTTTVRPNPPRPHFEPIFVPLIGRRLVKFPLLYSSA
ncbi:MAG: hypothetical protein KF834_08375 [Burkholderiales bacterium]|nr:hypothetical protein [Burkholderiales bacterium]